MYVIVKALHITAVILWIGTMAVAPLLPREAPEQLRLRIRGLMSVGLIATWVAGLSLANSAALLGTSWLTAKLLLVVALTAWHGVLAGRLRRGGGRSPSQAGRAGPWLATSLLLCAVLTIVLLVLLKPSV